MVYVLQLWRKHGVCVLRVAIRNYSLGGCPWSDLFCLNYMVVHFPKRQQDLYLVWKHDLELAGWIKWQFALRFIGLSSLWILEFHKLPVKYFSNCLRPILESRMSSFTYLDKPSNHLVVPFISLFSSKKVWLLSAVANIKMQRIVLAILGVRQ